jgi:hypothetical protein
VAAGLLLRPLLFQAAADQRAERTQSIRPQGLARGGASGCCTGSRRQPAIMNEGNESERGLVQSSRPSPVFIGRDIGAAASRMTPTLHQPVRFAPGSKWSALQGRPRRGRLPGDAPGRTGEGATQRLVCGGKPPGVSFRAGRVAVRPVSVSRRTSAPRPGMRTGCCLTPFPSQSGRSRPVRSPSSSAKRDAVVVSETVHGLGLREDRKAYRRPK